MAEDIFKYSTIQKDSFGHMPLYVPHKFFFSVHARLFCQTNKACESRAAKSGAGPWGKN